MLDVRALFDPQIVLHSTWSNRMTTAFLSLRNSTTSPSHSSTDGTRAWALVAISRHTFQSASTRHGTVSRHPFNLPTAPITTSHKTLYPLCQISSVPARSLNSSHQGRRLLRWHKKMALPRQILPSGMEMQQVVGRTIGHVSRHKSSLSFAD